MIRIATVAILTFVTAISYAAAQTRPLRALGSIELASCHDFTEQEVRTALDAEFREMPVSEGEPIDLQIECAGEFVVVSVGNELIRPRALDTSDVPVRLRPRLLALVITEILLITALHTADADAEADADADADANADADEPNAPVFEGSADASTESPSSVTEETPRSIETNAHVLTAPSNESHRPSRNAIVRISPGGTRTQSPLITAIVRPSLRVFTERGNVLVGGDALARVGPVAVGIAAHGAPPTHDPLGTMTPTLVVGVVELSVICLDHELLELCLGSEARIGYAAVEAHNQREFVRANSFDAPYVEGALRISTALVFAPVAIGIDFSFGWAEGLIALADTRELMTLSGPVIGIGVALEVLP